MTITGYLKHFVYLLVKTIAFPLHFVRICKTETTSKRIKTYQEKSPKHTQFTRPSVWGREVHGSLPSSPCRTLSQQRPCKCVIGVPLYVYLSWLLILFIVLCVFVCVCVVFDQVSIGCLYVLLVLCFLVAFLRHSFMCPEQLFSLISVKFDGLHKQRSNGAA